MPPALAYAPVPEIDLPEVDLLAAFQAHTARLGLHVPAITGISLVLITEFP
jgi:hypothetical protein